MTPLAGRKAAPFIRTVPVAQLGAEADLPPIGLPQPHLMVALRWINLDEPAGSTRLIQEGVDVRQRLRERLRDGVEAPVAVADAPRHVRLPRENTTDDVTGSRMLDPAAIGQVVQLSAGLCRLPGREALDGTGPRRGPGGGLEDELDPAVRREAEGQKAGKGGGRVPPEVSDLGCERCKGRVVLSLKGDRGVDEAERRDVELRTSTSFGGRYRPRSKGARGGGRGRRGAEPGAAGVGDRPRRAPTPSAGPSLSTCHYGCQRVRP